MEVYYFSSYLPAIRASGSIQNDSTTRRSICLIFESASPIQYLQALQTLRESWDVHVPVYRAYIPCSTTARDLCDYALELSGDFSKPIVFPDVLMDAEVMIEPVIMDGFEHEGEEQEEEDTLFKASSLPYATWQDLKRCACYGNDLWTILHEFWGLNRIQYRAISILNQSGLVYLKTLCATIARECMIEERVVSDAILHLTPLHAQHPWVEIDQGDKLRICRSNIHEVNQDPLKKFLNPFLLWTINDLGPILPLALTNHPTYCLSETAVFQYIKQRIVDGIPETDVTLDVRPDHPLFEFKQLRSKQWIATSRVDPADGIVYPAYCMSQSEAEDVFDDTPELKRFNLFQFKSTSPHHFKPLSRAISLELRFLSQDGNIRTYSSPQEFIESWIEMKLTRLSQFAELYQDEHDLIQEARQLISSIIHHGTVIDPISLAKKRFFLDQSDKLEALQEHYTQSEILIQLPIHLLSADICLSMDDIMESVVTVRDIYSEQLVLAFPSSSSSEIKQSSQTYKS